jgi:hypothetical protein
MARWPFRTLPRPGAGRFSQQKVFQDKLPFAGDEWSTANTACRFEIDDFRLRFCSDDLVQGIAVWAAEKRRFVRIRHERPQHFCFAPRGEHCAQRLIRHATTRGNRERTLTLQQLRQLGDVGGDSSAPRRG